MTCIETSKMADREVTPGRSCDLFYTNSMCMCFSMFVCVCVANGCTYMFDSFGSEGVKTKYPNTKILVLTKDSLLLAVSTTRQQID